jgi:hypothetical protein
MDAILAAQLDDVQLDELMQYLPTYSEDRIREKCLAKIHASKRAHGLKLVRGRRKLFSVLRTAAMFALALLLTGTVAISVNAELREKLFDWFVETFPQYSDFRVSTDVPLTEESFDKLALYEPTYIPDGFSEFSIGDMDTMVYFDYSSNDDGSLLSIMGRLPTGGAVGMNTEGVEIEKTSFQGEEAYYWEKDGIAYYTFILDGYHFTITGPLARSEIYKIAENIKTP